MNFAYMQELQGIVSAMEKPSAVVDDDEVSSATTDFHFYN